MKKNSDHILEFNQILESYPAHVIAAFDQFDLVYMYIVYTNFSRNADFNEDILRNAHEILAHLVGREHFWAQIE